MNNIEMNNNNNNKMKNKEKNETITYKCPDALIKLTSYKFNKCENNKNKNRKLPISYQDLVDCD